MIVVGEVIEVVEMAVFVKVVLVLGRVEGKVMCGLVVVLAVLEVAEVETVEVVVGLALVEVVKSCSGVEELDNLSGVEVDVNAEMVVKVGLVFVLLPSTKII